MSFSPNDTEFLFQQLASYYLKELSVEEANKVEQWIAANEANAKQYQAVQQLLQQNHTIEPIVIDTDKGWIELNSKIQSLKIPTNSKVRNMQWYWAAAVMLGLLVGGWLFFQSANTSNVVWITKTGFDTLQLADGSLIVANGKATIKYKKDFNQGNREVKLEGDAFFKVHRDTTQPFNVVFNAGNVTVLGTQFTINQKAQGFEVKVTEGKVKAAVSNQKGEAILTRGQMAMYDKAANQFRIQAFAEASMLKYTNESIQTILKDVFLTKGLLIKADQEIATMKLTVDFVKSQPEEILQTLELLTQGHLRKVGANQYQLIKN